MLSDEDRRRAVESCRYCPMCHHADLTVTLERRETYSARARGLLLFAAGEGPPVGAEEIAEVLYRFFADGLCRKVCAGDIPHDEMVIEGRRHLVAAGQAPRAVARVRQSIERTGNPWGEQEPDLLALTGARAQRQILVYFGPAARIRRPDSVRALSRVLQAGDITFSVLREEGDPGLLLYQLGEAEAGSAAASALARQIKQSGARTVVTPDADAYRVFKCGLGDVPPLSTVEVRHSSELLVDLVAHLRIRKPTRSRIAYHDPCALARFARCWEAPRVVVSRICGTAPLEIGPWTRELAHCSGECGGVPFMRPELARKAAAHRLNAVRRVGAELLVAGSAAAAAALDTEDLKVQELSEFVAGYLES